MADEFEIGSIAKLIGGSEKKQKTPKKLTTEIVEVVSSDSTPSSKKRKQIGATPKTDNASLAKTNKSQPLSEEVTDEEEESDSQIEDLSESQIKKTKTGQNKPSSAVKPQANIKTKNAEDNNETSEKAKLARTLFVGNLPVSFDTKKLKQKFQTYGKVSSVRIRSVAPAKITLSKKAALLSNQVNPNKKTVNAYVVFAAKESMEKAKELNGTIIDEHTIQVSAACEPGYDAAMAIFIGNLSFKVNEDEVRNFFKDCGEIKNVRIIRDSKTGIGKGFGYVNFVSKDSVVLALDKNGQELKGREVRIKKYSYTMGGGAARQGKQPSKVVGATQTELRSPSKFNHLAKGKGAVPRVKKNQQFDFKGEQSVKKGKVMKKTMKSKIKSSKVKKHRKNLSEILSK